MPFISLAKKDASKVLSICHQISPRQSDIEIFCYTKISFIGSQVVFEAINPNVYFKKSLPVEATQDLVIMIKTDVLAGAVNLISDEIIGLDINLDKDVVVIQGAKTKHTLRTNNKLASDFLVPMREESLEAWKLKVPADELSKALKVAMTTIGQPKNVYQPEFLNICLTLKPDQQNLAVVSSDTRRLSKTVLSAEFLQQPTQKPDNQMINYLVQPKGLQLLAAISEGELQIDFENDYLWADFGDSTMTLRYGEGKYPDYEKIIPQSFTCTLTLNTKDLQEALKQVYLSAKANVVNKSVVLTVNPAQKNIQFSATTDDGYASESVIGIENYEGVEDPWSQSFNAEYLLDYIANVSADNILWEANPGKPLMMSPENQKDRQFCLVSGLK
jgi:DNA polymerase III sliding clamp (beta) subunit (PCNA family)